MIDWSPQLVAPWSPADMQAILDDAVRVLGTVGVECTHETVRGRLAERGGVTFAGDRIRFAAEPLRAHVEMRRGSYGASLSEDSNQFSLGGCWVGLNYCDPGTQDVRPASSEEAAMMARLWDARGISGVIPVMPGDVPPALATLVAERIALENSRFLGCALSVTDPEEVRFLIDLYAAAGRRYHLVEQVGISPLRLNHEGLTTALSFLGHPDVDVSLGGFMPMAGATCPLDPRAAVVQSVAESLAVDIVCSTLGCTGGGLSIRVEPFDFRDASIVFGSPEWCLFKALVSRMNEYLMGRPERHGMFRTVAKRPDAQAACERTASVLWQALLGARHFGGVGQLSVDEVFSPQQAVLDREILGYVKRVIEGLPLESGAPDPIALIEEGVREGSFIGVADTVTRFREFYCFPDIFRRWNVGRWRAEGRPSILDEAWARAKDEIAKSTHQLDEKQSAEIAGIYEQAALYIRDRA